MNTPPGYRDVADDLRDAIVRGDYPPGTTIPKETELMARYGLGRDAIRRAVARLRAEGLVVPIRRRGTVVRDRTPVRLPVSRYADVLTPTGDCGPWETACQQQGVRGRTAIVTVDQRAADSVLAEQLKVPNGTPVVHREQHMYAGEQVAQVQNTWLPLALVDGTPLADHSKVDGGIYRALANLGHPPASADEDVTARMPTREEAQTLSLDLGSPVLAIQRVTRGKDGRVLVVVHAVVAGDRVKLRYDQTFDQSASQPRDDDDQTARS